MNLSDPIALITDPAKSAGNPDNPTITAGFTRAVPRPRHEKVNLDQRLGEVFISVHADLSRPERSTTSRA